MVTIDFGVLVSLTGAVIGVVLGLIGGTSREESKPAA